MPNGAFEHQIEAQTARFSPEGESDTVRHSKSTSWEREERNTPPHPTGTLHGGPVHFGAISKPAATSQWRCFWDPFPGATSQWRCFFRSGPDRCAPRKASPRLTGSILTSRSLAAAVCLSVRSFARARARGLDMVLLECRTERSSTKLRHERPDSAQRASLTPFGTPRALISSQLGKRGTKHHPPPHRQLARPLHGGPLHCGARHFGKLLANFFANNFSIPLPKPLIPDSKTLKES